MSAQKRCLLVHNSYTVHSTKHGCEQTDGCTVIVKLLAHSKDKYNL